MSKKSWFDETPNADIWTFTACEICEAFRNPVCLCLQDDVNSGVDGGQLLCPKLMFSKEICIEMYKEGLKKYKMKNFEKHKKDNDKYCINIFTGGKHTKFVDSFFDYEKAITYIAQNPLSSAAEEYRIGLPSYDDEGLACMEYLYPPEFAEDVEKIRKGGKLDYDYC